MSETNSESLNLPQIAADRCVHTLITNASCRACLETCHVNAWRLNHRQLELDTSLCDGCGVCASVCPETAIEHTHNPLSIHWNNEQLVLLACEKIPESHSTQVADGLVNCVHALSLRDIATLYNAGHRRLLVSAATCEDCSRGSIDYLNQHLSQLNALLKESAQPGLERVNISGEQWLNILRSAVHTGAGTSLSRRQFLRKTATEISDYGLDYFDLKSDEQHTPTPIGAFLPAAPDKQVLPYVPKIDTQLCSACDTCMKLCPHQALIMDKLEGDAVYQINAIHCTACMICVDVCEDEAIHIEHNTISSQQLIALNEVTCQSCGVRFHTLDSESKPLCPICQKKKHHTALYQMLD